MPGKYWLETYGCQMNFAESNALEIEFAAAGLVPAIAPEEADIVVLNTCSVRQTAENRIWGRLGFFQHMKNDRKLTVVLTGCMAERLAGDVKKRSPAVDYVVGTNDKLRLMDIISDINVKADSYQFKPLYKGHDSAKTLLPIMNGCNNFCAYCIVPYVRGREISRNPEEVFREVEALAASGVREITLLGQNVNSYKYSMDSGKTVDFPQLLARISDIVAEDVWIRFISSHPKDFPLELIQLIADRKNICSHLHLPVQSGSSRILASMKRKYTREHYLDLVRELRNADKAITFSTDILVGFPGETEEDFLETISLVEQVGYLDAFMYYFNPREGTEAMKMPDHLDKEVKLDRLQRLIEFQRKLSSSIKKTRIGIKEKVLCEGVTKRDNKAYLTRSEHDDIVIIREPGLEVGSFYTVTITDLKGNTYEGVLE